MLFRNLPIKWKIAGLSFGLVLFSLVIGCIIILGSITQLQQRELGQRLMITARTVANLPSIQDEVGHPEALKRGEIQSVAEKLRIINDVSYIVVLDMNRIRYSHPIESRIGGHFEGTDADGAFAEHTYLSKVKGEAGMAIRAYVPIMNPAHEQIGVVVAGQLLPSLYELALQQKGPVAVMGLLSLLFGLWGSWRLAASIKRQMLNLEPHEITRMFQERTAAFQAMHEGVIAIDNEETITLFNDRAKEIFDIRENVVGRRIREVIPDSRLPEILRQQQPVFNQELFVGQALIWSNRIPIRVRERTVGAIAIFQDRTEVARAAEELTGVKAFVDALRVQNHEYMNKLHTIAGLLQLGQTDKALDYLFQVSLQQEELTGFLKHNFADESVAGLLLSKIGRGRELGIEVNLDRRSGFTGFPPFLDRHDFVILLGNLLENAFDALSDCPAADGGTRPDDEGKVQPDGTPKRITISIEQDEEVLSIMVEDNGCGMDEETRKRMTERGFSTKSKESRGIGLYLVGRIVEKGRGELECQTSPGEGTAFTVTFPMNEDEALSGKTKGEHDL